MGKIKIWTCNRCDEVLDKYTLKTHKCKIVKVDVAKQDAWMAWLQLEAIKIIGVCKHFEECKEGTLDKERKVTLCPAICPANKPPEEDNHGSNL